MSIITVSRGSYSHGREIAERVAQALGYECISREILIEASKEFNIPEMKLFHAIHDAPSILDRILLKREKYITYFNSAILKHLKKDNVVYHGFAGHFFLKGISHVLKVRIIADMEERIRLIKDRNRITTKEATRYIEKLDKQRRKWSMDLYGIETSDPSLYDMVINVSQLPVEDAIRIICNKVALKRFQTTPESQRKIEELSRQADLKASLMDIEAEPQSRASKRFTLKKQQNAVLTN